MAAQFHGGDTGDDPVRSSAARVFASMGYDLASVHMLAEAAGVSRDVIEARGGKSGLYQEIIERFSSDSIAMLTEAERDFRPDEKGMHRFLDRALDFYLDHPAELAIWQHRRLDDAADLVDLDARYHMSSYRKIQGILGPDLMAVPTMQMFLSVLIWSVVGFSVGGIPDIERVVIRADTIEGRVRFRAEMHRLLDLVIDSLSR
ncbi:TetR/AcrR family transcriptional regulator [Actinocorallia sp. API 0066]|uniref:TetR/AcrR family transcriptional regulator n=1 Tax=Actinocorallia sp. API 0066 TaxID=2896846 RepID=UPI001E607873|nr:TetR/AcrR family transcriptional regulator [Actinocorallia sp. API 0066]MCD0449292.1 TetR/AcrR family transcriptional regulator [Actinocorallia sp. API 0066]